MADFSTPFADQAEKRLATTDEKQNGFPCGPASQSLFNGLTNQIQSELNAIHQAGGIAGDDAAFNTTLLNIQALIDAATGEGDTTGYLLLTQAASRLPIFPEFNTLDGKINVTSPSTGTIRLPGGIDFMHRGISPQTTTQTDIATDINKTYHLRWNPVNGFTLNDLANASYNPSVLAETHINFDSKYDDMLVARIITNSSNVATITNLVNKHQLITQDQTEDAINPTSFQNNTAPFDLGPGTNASVTFDLNWSRFPYASNSGWTDATTSGTGDGEMNLVVQSLSRYQVRCLYEKQGNPGGAWISFVARA